MRPSFDPDAPASHRLGLVVAVLLFLVHLLTLHGAFQWAGTAAGYALHARNLVEGKPYAETGYVRNPLRVPGQDAGTPHGVPVDPPRATPIRFSISHHDDLIRRRRGSKHGYQAAAKGHPAEMNRDDHGYSLHPPRRRS